MANRIRLILVFLIIITIPVKAQKRNKQKICMANKEAADRGRNTNGKADAY